eukprot:gene4564-4818_t
MVTIALNCRRLPEMMASTLLATVVGFVFVLAVAAALLALMYNDSRYPRSRLVAAAAAASQVQGASGAAVADPGAAFRRLRLLSLRRCTLSHNNVLANKVEVAVADQGSAVVGLVREMPSLRFLDVTWLNLEPWELQELVQYGKQLHYLGLGKQQVGVVMSQEAQLGRSLCGDSKRVLTQRARNQAAAAASKLQRAQQQLAQQPLSGGDHGSTTTSSGFASMGWLWQGFPGLITGRVLGGVLGRWWVGAAAAAAVGWRQQQHRHQDVLGGLAVSSGVIEGFDLFCDDVGPLVVLVEAPAGFDELIEREIMTSAPAAVTCP